MALEWIQESPAYWDEPKERIIGGAPAGIFNLEARESGDLVPGDWWRVEDGGSVVGYGWMDATWGDAEILLAVDPEAQGRGVGSFILDRLDREARARGLNYLYNIVRPSHPDRKGITRWLEKRGFAGEREGQLRRRVATGVS